jgi:hypothetical protein
MSLKEQELVKQLLGGSDGDVVEGDASRGAFDNAVVGATASFAGVRPEDVGRKPRTFSAAEESKYLGKMTSDKAFAKAAGHEVLDSEEEWPLEQRHPKAMPLWMMWQYARSDVESDGAGTEFESPPKLVRGGVPRAPGSAPARCAPPSCRTPRPAPRVLLALPRWALW